MKIEVIAGEEGELTRVRITDGPYGVELRVLGWQVEEPSLDNIRTTGQDYVALTLWLPSGDVEEFKS